MINTQKNSKQKAILSNGHNLKSLECLYSIVQDTEWATVFSSLKWGVVLLNVLPYFVLHFLSSSDIKIEKKNEIVLFFPICWAMLIAIIILYFNLKLISTFLHVLYPNHKFPCQYNISSAYILIALLTFQSED